MNKDKSDDPTIVDIKDALSSHDIHLSAPVPIGLLAYFCVVKMALGHDQARRLMR